MERELYRKRIIERELYRERIIERGRLGSMLRVANSEWGKNLIHQAALFYTKVYFVFNENTFLPKFPLFPPKIPSSSPIYFISTNNFPHQNYISSTNVDSFPTYLFSVGRYTSSP